LIHKKLLTYLLFIEKVNITTMIPGFGYFLILLWTVVVFFEWPKLVSMVEDEIYHSIPFGRFDPPIISSTKRWWLILHVVIASLNILLLSVCWWDNLIIQQPILLIPVDFVMVVFITMILCNFKRLGPSPIWQAVVINLVTQTILFGCMISWTVLGLASRGNQYANGISISLELALVTLSTAPLVAAGQTLYSRIFCPIKVGVVPENSQVVKGI
jgi:hypothetical protein